LGSSFYLGASKKSKNAPVAQASQEEKERTLFSSAVRSGRRKVGVGEKGKVDFARRRHFRKEKKKNREIVRRGGVCLKKQADERGELGES